VELILNKHLWRIDLWLLDPIQRFFEEFLDIAKVRLGIIVVVHDAVMVVACRVAFVRCSRGRLPKRGRR
jgi:hypothetical protein